MEISRAVKDYLIEIEVRKYSPRTIRSYRCNLNLFLRFCEEKEGISDTEDIRLGTVKQLAKFMSETGHKGTYINSLLKTIKSFIQYCYDEGEGGFNTKKTSSGVRKINR